MADREKFVRLIAKYLVEDAVKKSIALQLQRPDAIEWSEIRATTPIFGYPTVEQAAAELSEWLGVPTDTRVDPEPKDG